MTHEQLLRFQLSNAGLEPSGTRLLVFRPETGRTHQIRVAAKSLGSPILGDPLYGAADAACSHSRCYLHAAAIRVPPLFEGDVALQVILCWPVNSVS